MGWFWKIKSHNSFLGEIEGMSPACETLDYLHWLGTTFGSLFTLLDVNKQALHKNIHVCECELIIKSSKLYFFKLLFTSNVVVEEPTWYSFTNNWLGVVTNMAWSSILGWIMLVVVHPISKFVVFRVVQQNISTSLFSQFDQLGEFRAGHYLFCNPKNRFRP